MRGFILILFLGFLSCNSNKEKSERSLHFKELKGWLAIHDKSLVDSIVIIPNLGCTGCISSAQKYFDANVSNENNLFIFTQIDDLKMFKQIVEEELWSRKNILVDTNDFLIQHGVDSIYPLLITGAKFNKISISIFQPER